jgi:alpha-ribazole phosphatase
MRHGEPEGAGRMLGHTDSPATPAGIAACRERATGLACDRVVSSDLSRAVACAEAIAGRAVPTDARWRELDFGAWEGLLAAEIDGGALGRFWDDPDAHPPPGGERWTALVARVGAALDEAEGATLVVTHAGAIRAALARLCGFDQRQLWCFHLPYAAVVSVRIWRGPEPTAQIVAMRT